MYAKVRRCRFVVSCNYQLRFALKTQVGSKRCLGTETVLARFEFTWMLEWGA